MSKVYRSCNELPLFNFIQVASSNNLKYLTVSGFPTKSDLQSAWDDILQEYLLLSNSSQHNNLLACLKDIAVLTNKVNIIQAIVDQLSIHYHISLVNNLKTLGFRFKYDPSSPDQYYKDLQTTVSQSKSLLVRLDQRKKDLEALRGQDDGKATDYESILTELSKFQGYRLNTKEITVAEFVAILKRFKEANKPKK